jgi:hypothetical protein
MAELSKQRKLKQIRISDTARGKRDIVPYKYAKRIYERIRELKIKGLSSAPYQGNLSMCLHKELNVYRLGLLQYIASFECDDPVLNDACDLLANNRFSEITAVENTTFEAVDIEVDGGLFIASAFLTHNCKIGVMFGNPETTTGGNALKFYSSVRLDIRRTGSVDNGTGDAKQAVGNHVRVRVVKNKVAPPFRQAEFDIRFAMGIDKLTDLIGVAVTENVVEKAGAFYKYAGSSYQGIEKFRAALEDEALHTRLYDEVTRTITTTK